MCSRTLLLVRAFCWLLRYTREANVDAGWIWKATRRQRLISHARFGIHMCLGTIDWMVEHRRILIKTSRVVRFSLSSLIRIPPQIEQPTHTRVSSRKKPAKAAELYFRGAPSPLRCFRKCLEGNAISWMRSLRCLLELVLWL